MIVYSLVLTCDAIDRLAETLRSFREFVYPIPAPRSVFVVNDGSGSRSGEIAETVIGELPRPLADSSIQVRGNHRHRHGPEFAFGRAWDAAGALAEESPVALILPSGYRLLRGIDLADVANVLGREPLLAQIVFLADYATGGYRPRGQAIRWLVRDGGFEVAPCLVPTGLARSFPWPKNGAVDLELGLRSSLPGTAFAAWGDGRPWIAAAA